MKIRPVLERLLNKIKIDEQSGCWLWTGAVSKGTGRYERLSGYGYIRDTKTGKDRAPLILVHRAAYRELVGPIPDGLEVDHACVNRVCCNPKHLSVVTHKKNCQLMKERSLSKESEEALNDIALGEFR